MEKTLKIINQLQRKNLITQYAIGGGIAAVFYMEPVLTYDLGIFIFLPHSESEIINLSPIYEFLNDKGYQTSHEHIVIEGVPVQFIPVYNPLVKEAVIQAREIKYKQTKTRVIRIEHLLAIMFQTNRPKDKTRIIQLLEEAEINTEELQNIFQRHKLYDEWLVFKERIYGK